MKITGIELFTVPPRWLFLKISTDEGISGWGEPIVEGRAATTAAAVNELSEYLIGRDPNDIEDIWQVLYRGGFYRGGALAMSAIAGIDQALWDIKGKVLGVPVWSLLGGQVRSQVRMYAHASTPETALALKARGVTALKCGGVSNPVRKIAALREAVGDEIDLMIDLHGPPWLTPADAATLARELEPYKLLFMEDPIAPENLDGYRRIRDASNIPLAAGERMSTIFGLRQLIEQELVDVVQPDTGRAGGITQMKKIAAMAEAHHIMMAPHSGSLGPVAEYAALHLLAAIPNTLFLERIEDDWDGRDHTALPALHQHNGFLTVPTAPGLGVDIDEDFVARFPSQANVSIPVTPASGAYAEGTFEEHVYVQTRLKRAHYFPKG